jgi:hypothetical protein
MDDVYDLVVIGAGQPKFSEVCLPGSASSHSSLIHSTAWKGYSAKFACRILHITPPESREDGFYGPSSYASGDYMLW